jgi:phosphatidate cytidylyltransferase
VLEAEEDGEEGADPEKPTGEHAAAESEPEPSRRRSPARLRIRRGSETTARVLWAVPWIVFAVAIVALGGPVFAVAMVGLAWAVQIELFRMTARSRPFEAAAFLGAFGMVAAAYFGSSLQILLALVAAVPVMLFFALLRPSPKNVTWSFAITVLALVWVALPFAHAVLLRELPLHGGALLVDVLVATFFADTFAYLGGRMFGQRQLSPRVSPNKTIEGLLIGILGGVLGFWLAGLYQDWLSGPEALLFGLCIALLAPLGDLFESAVKRDLDVKDTGRMLGPHGGLLDRLDAVLFTIVAGYYLALAIVY